MYTIWFQLPSSPKVHIVDMQEMSGQRHSPYSSAARKRRVDSPPPISLKCSPIRMERSRSPSLSKSPVSERSSERSISCHHRLSSDSDSENDPLLARQISMARAAESLGAECPGTAFLSPITGSLAKAPSSVQVCLPSGSIYCQCHCSMFHAHYTRWQLLNAPPSALYCFECLHLHRMNICKAWVTLRHDMSWAVYVSYVKIVINKVCD